MRGLLPPVLGQPANRRIAQNGYRLLVTFLLFFFLPEQATGVAQRVFVAVTMTWLAVIGWWMRHLDDPESVEHAGRLALSALLPAQPDLPLDPAGARVELANVLADQPEDIVISDERLGPVGRQKIAH